MAADFLRGYGVDLQQILESGSDTTESLPLPLPEPIISLTSVLLAGSSTDLYDITIDPKIGIIKSVEPAKPLSSSVSSPTPNHRRPFSPSSSHCLVFPSLCHPHVHLDKPYLLSYPNTSHLVPQTGTFAEALSLTADAKKFYTPASLLERGNWLIADSVRAGVTHLRGFVEVDITVGMMCLEAGLEMKRLWQGRCEVQICVFAQDPVMSGMDGDENRRLMEEAVTRVGVDVIGSTPYVESDEESTKKNIDWAIGLAMREGLHLDFHLDYQLDEGTKAMVWYVLSKLKEVKWSDSNLGKTVCLGHCTRLTLFTNAEWERLRQECLGMPVSFIGLPTSDIFMQGRPAEGHELDDRKRATLQIPWMIDKLDLKAALGINNVGNAFTPQGSADPLSIASMGIGLYQAGKVSQAGRLYVS